jgi:hypothetical protein
LQHISNICTRTYESLYLTRLDRFPITAKINFLQTRSRTSSTSVLCRKDNPKRTTIPYLSHRSFCPYNKAQICGQPLCSEIVSLVISPEPPSIMAPLTSIDAPGVKAEGSLLYTMRQEVAALLDRKNTNFPGAQPVSFSRRHLEELKKEK